MEALGICCFEVNLFAYTFKYLHIHIYFKLLCIHIDNPNDLIQLEALTLELKNYSSSPISE